MMLALPLVVLLLSASHSSPHEGKATRAARLMTDVELTQLASLDGQIVALPGLGGNPAVVSSIVALSAGLAIPVVVGAFSVVASAFIGFLGLISGGSSVLFSAIPGLWNVAFGWIPVWGWIAMGVAVAIGAGTLIGALVSDAPRRRQLAELKAERSRLIRLALSRPEDAMAQVPMTTLATF